MTEKQELPLGKFYSDSWEVKPNSAFVTCRSYDILSNLQRIKIYYPLQKGRGWDNAVRADGSIDESKITDKDLYFLDGSVSGNNANAKKVFEKVIKLINEQKIASGVYGEDVLAVLDERLSNITMPYVLLGADTAWNILQQLANFCTSFVYCDRDGNVCVKADDAIVSSQARQQRAARIANGEQVAAAEELVNDSGVTVNRSNSFALNLPTMEKTVVNRVTVPFVEFGEGKVEDNKVTVERKDFLVKKEKNEAIIEFKIKNIYKEGVDIVFQINDTTELLNPFIQTIKFSYNQVYVHFSNQAEITKITVKLQPLSSFSSLNTSSCILEDEKSQRKNGIEEFELKCGNLVCLTPNDQTNPAETLANKILNAYSNGAAYLDAQWRGTPRLELGQTFAGKTSKATEEDNTTIYECLSNEFTLGNGMRVKTKAREKMKP